jgi:hypothetical protein
LEPGSGESSRGDGGAGANTAQSVTLSFANSTATIHYTTDGTNPTVMSPVHTTPIDVTSTTEIRAMATAIGCHASPVAHGEFVIRH